jgi:exonuclease III
MFVIALSYMDKVDLNIFSLNANGLGEDTKRQAVFTKLKSKGKGIFLLTETHSCYEKQSKWESEWGNNNIIFSHGSTNSRGVAILFSNGFEFEPVKQYSDNDGRYVIVDIKHHNHIYTIASIYAPTKDKETEQIRVFKSLTENSFSQENLIIGGDFNVYMNPRLDKLDCMTLTNDNFKYRQDIQSFMDTEELLDIWRVMNPDTRFYTWS